MHKNFLTAILISATLVLGATPMSRAQTDSLTTQIDAVFKGYQKTTGPGCAVGVVKDGKLIFSKGYGIANLEYDIPITPASVFDIASVSKQFAGFAIAKLVHDGQLSLDDDVRKYVPDVPDFGKMITVRHLVHHTSGLRDWPQVLNVAGWRWDELFTFEDIMRMVKSQKDLDFPPGERFSYSNTGYNVLAEIVSKVSGKTFVKWTEENIFKPLEMRNSRFQNNYAVPIKNLAYSYDFGSSGLRKSPGGLTAYGSSSLFTSVDDLVKWVMYYNQQVEKNDPVFRLMLTEGKTNNGEAVHYGFGLGHGKDRGLETISHTGGWQAYRTIITNYPEQKVSIIILSNYGGFNVNKFSNEVASVVLKNQLKSDANSVASDLKNAPTIKMDEALVKKYAGTYQLGPGWLATLTAEPGGLMVQATGEARFATAAKSDSTIWIDAYNASMTFVKDKNGDVNLLRYKGINAPRVNPYTADPKDFPLYAGTYYSTELATEYKVYLEDEKLKIWHFRHGTMPLTPDQTGPDQFNSGVGNIKFTRDAKKKVTGFTISGGRVKNLRFDRR